MLKSKIEITQRESMHINRQGIFTLETLNQKPSPNRYLLTLAKPAKSGKHWPLEAP
jgi:hypothetical protein